MHLTAVLALFLASVRGASCSGRLLMHSSSKSKTIQNQSPSELAQTCSVSSLNFILHEKRFITITINRCGLQLMLHSRQIGWMVKMERFLCHVLCFHVTGQDGCGITELTILCRVQTTRYFCLLTRSLCQIS